MWLHLGAEIGAFPERAGRIAYDEYLSPFFRSIVDPNNTQEYAQHSRESQEMRDLLPHFGQILIDKALRGEQGIFSAERLEFAKPQLLVGLFQVHWLLRDQVWRNVAVRSFIRVLNFSTDESWESTWQKECRPDEIAEAYFATTPTLGRALLFAGFLGIYKYSSRRKELNQSLLNDDVLDPSDVFKIESRIDEMQRWTVRLASSQIGRRFEQVKEGLFAALYDQYETDPNVTVEIVEAIRGSIEDALSFAPVSPLVPVEA